MGVNKADLALQEVVSPFAHDGLGASEDDVELPVGSL
jgi:hypothetical protein